MDYSKLSRLLPGSIQRVEDSSKGVDQKVTKVTTTQSTFIVKEQKKGSNHFVRTLYGTKIAEKKGVSSPTIFYAKDNIIIEDYISGHHPKTFRDYEAIGRTIKKIHTHSISGAGEITSLRGKTQSANAASNFLGFVDYVFESKIYYPEVQEALCFIVKNNAVLSNAKTVMLHGDLASDNIIMVKEKPVFMDWADTRAGPKEQEFAEVYIDVGNNPKLFAAFCKGYGAFNKTVFKLYAMLYCVWLWNDKRKKLLRNLL